MALNRPTALNTSCGTQPPNLTQLQPLSTSNSEQSNISRENQSHPFTCLLTHQCPSLLIPSYLTDRTQFVSLGRNYRSDIISSNTGAPQGTVLAPFLLTLYTSDCRTQEVMCPLIKFADDTAMTGLIHSDDDRAYLHQLQSFVEYCNTNFLQLNISKTKEMVIDFRHSVLQPPPVFIDGVEVERVSSYKYLGVHLTDSLTWGDQVDALIKKLNSRLYCLRKMAIFKVRTDVMNMFYNATIYGVWRYCLITWGGNVTKADKERIDGIIRKAGGIIGEPQTTVDSVYDCLLQSKLDLVWKDPGHPLHCHLHNNIITRGSGRLRLPPLRTNRHRKSFIPRAIKLYNNNICR